VRCGTPVLSRGDDNGRIAEAGIDVDILAERLQREAAGRFCADWAALLAAIQEKAGKLETERTGSG
jgi:hypothetical protein